MAYKIERLLTCRKVVAYLWNPQGGTVSIQAQDCALSTQCVENFRSAYVVGKSVGSPDLTPQPSPTPKCSDGSRVSPAGAIFIVSTILILASFWSAW